MVVKITKEDERLLEEYSQAASKSSEKLVYVNAIMISSIPICMLLKSKPNFTRVILGRSQNASDS